MHLHTDVLVLYFRKTVIHKCDITYSGMGLIHVIRTRGRKVDCTQKEDSRQHCHFSTSHWWSSSSVCTTFPKRGRYISTWNENKAKFRPLSFMTFVNLIQYVFNYMFLTIGSSHMRRWSSRRLHRVKPEGFSAISEQPENMILIFKPGSFSLRKEDGLVNMMSHLVSEKHGEGVHTKHANHLIEQDLVKRFASPILSKDHYKLFQAELFFILLLILVWGDPSFLT